MEAATSSRRPARLRAATPGRIGSRLRCRGRPPSSIAGRGADERKGDLQSRRARPVTSPNRRLLSGPKGAHRGNRSSCCGMAGRFRRDATSVLLANPRLGGSAPGRRTRNGRILLRPERTTRTSPEDASGSGVRDREGLAGGRTVDARPSCHNSGRGVRPRPRPGNHRTSADGRARQMSVGAQRWRALPEVTMYVGALNRQSSPAIARRSGLGAFAPRLGARRPGWKGLSSWTVRRQV